jgi:hypothetical protein
MPAVISPAMIASLVYGACGLLAAATVEYLMRAFAAEAGVNRWVFVAVPGLFAMLFAMAVYQGAQRTMRNVGESVSRGILIALLTWLAFSSLATWVRCPGADFGQCFAGTLIVTGIVGGGPMLAAALVGGLLAGVLIIRPPAAPRPEPREPA